MSTPVERLIGDKLTTRPVMQVQINEWAFEGVFADPVWLDDVSLVPLSTIEQC